ncbi:hypothetical protein Pmar_PMAR024149 [Perkinsus marinus ATCC 50983]|uniref:Uncharacterized protein n=1 Tax=Perkinsus marinus (strain ATCC 50983 / TXsc) TaxID=423536 RepID=C5L2B3_PERM5|nr:hypothetical protein Pmar_PMAR024149 [Perkinsus marinus ATCC 50983]EER09125.1 hypothetical protein Pmar_PMAR024149 [Perkinsus marinus ATCC 50983]|eukprot:XP_002777309.1 hypothetical protein Pmar_PMAR024149 [Perkinsus marinus ATCC 50983]
MGPAPPIPFTEGSDEEDEPPSAPELIQATEQLKLMALESSDRHERRITCELLRSALLDMIGSGDIKGTVDLSRLLADDEDDTLSKLSDMVAYRIETYAELLCMRYDLGKPLIKVHPENVLLENGILMTVDYSEHPHFKKAAQQQLARVAGATAGYRGTRATYVGGASFS